MKKDKVVKKKVVKKSKTNFKKEVRKPADNLVSNIQEPPPEIEKPQVKPESQSIITEDRMLKSTTRRYACPKCSYCPIICEYKDESIYQYRCPGCSERWQEERV